MKFLSQSRRRFRAWWAKQRWARQWGRLQSASARTRDSFTSRHQCRDCMRRMSVTVTVSRNCRYGFAWLRCREHGMVFYGEVKLPFITSAALQVPGLNNRLIINWKHNGVLYEELCPWLADRVAGRAIRAAAATASRAQAR